MPAQKPLKPKPATPAKTRGDSAAERKATFAAEYLRDFNAKEAAIRAGYSSKTAAQAGCRLLKDRMVMALIAPKREQAAVSIAQTVSSMSLSIERTKLEIARLAYFDPRKLFDAKGDPIALTELDDDTAAAIAGLDVLEEWDGAGDARTFVGYVKKYKIADKNAALEKAAKILGLYEKDNEQKKPELAEQLAAFVGQLHSSGAARLPIAARRKA